MKIIAVNIHKTYVKKGAKKATEEAWNLNEEKFKENLPEFVIGVASGKIHGYFKFLNVFRDTKSKRLKFSLIDCSSPEIDKIDQFTNGKNLKYFVIKHKW